MSKTYESLEPQGHFNFAKRVFQKIKGYIDSKSTSMTLDNYNALTPSQKNDGTIRFIPASSSSGTSTAFDMSGITSYKEYNMSIAATSSTETNVSWDGGNAIGCNWNYTTQVDVTNISAITFTVTNGSCYGGGAQAQQTSWDVQIGLMATPPTSVTNVLPSDSSWAVVADMPLSNHTYEETLDVSELSGNYYIVCFAHGWNTTIEDIVFRSGEGYSSQIKYMSETYGNNIDDVKVNGTSVVDANKVAQIDLTPYAESADLAPVATSGDYDDLSNKPTIPPTLTASGNIEIDNNNVIKRKEVWLNSMADYNALSSVDSDTDYHVKGIFAITFSANKVIISDNNGNLIASDVTTEKLNQASDLTEAYRVVNGELYVVYDDGL